MIYCRLLYKHLFNVIDQLYGQNLGCESPLSVAESVSRILSLGQDLVLWENALPSALQVVDLTAIRGADEPTPGGPQSHLKFQIILSLRYYHLQTILHRPILAKYLKACVNSTMDNSADERLLQQIGFNSVQVCSEAARNIIDIIHEVLHSKRWHTSLLGAWWFSLYYSKFDQGFATQ